MQTIIFIICLVILIININPSSANSKTGCSFNPSYPTHSIKFFIPHTITVFIFSSPPNPSYYFHHSNDLNLLPSPSPYTSSSSSSSYNIPIPSLSAKIINQHFKLFNHYQHENKNKKLDSKTKQYQYPMLSYDDSMVNNNNNNNNNNDNISDSSSNYYDFCEIPHSNLTVTKSYIDIILNNIENIEFDGVYIENMVKIYLSQLTTLINDIITIFIKTCIKIQYLLKDIKCKEIIKGIYETIYNLRGSIINYTNHCNQFIPYLSGFIPSDLSHIVVQEMCAIFVIGVTILFILISIFITVWLWYKNMINQYLALSN